MGRIIVYEKGSEHRFKKLWPETNETNKRPSNQDVEEAQKFAHNRVQEIIDLCPETNNTNKRKSSIQHVEEVQKSALNRIQEMIEDNSSDDETESNRKRHEFEVRKRSVCKSLVNDDVFDHIFN